MERTHWSASSAVGLKMDGSSRPVPHSTPLNVFGPKWMKNVRSRRIHAVWLGRGNTLAAFSAITESESPPEMRCRAEYLIGAEPSFVFACDCQIGRAHV